MSKRLTRRIAVIAVVALGVVALGGTALAGHLGEVKSYTGCLVPQDGVIIKVKEGDVPASACKAGMQQVHLSGGDITKISVTGALTGGGANGEVTIGLKPEFTLPTGCTSGQVVKWNGATDDWECARDENTTYSAGTGLDLIGTTLPRFEIEPAYQVKNTPDCSSGQFATGFDASGNIQCAAASGSLQAFQARQANFTSGDGVPDDGGDHTYVTLAVPAGTYLVTGKGVLTQGDDDVGFRSTDAFGCRIGNLPAEFTSFFGKDNEPGEYGFALTGIVTTSGDAITLQCFAESDLDLISLENATLSALKIG